MILSDKVIAWFAGCEEDADLQLDRFEIGSLALVVSRHGVLVRADLRCFVWCLCGTEWARGSRAAGSARRRVTGLGSGYALPTMAYRRQASRCSPLSTSGPAGNPRRNGRRCPARTHAVPTTTSPPGIPGLQASESAGVAKISLVVAGFYETSPSRAGLVTGYHNKLWIFGKRQDNQPAATACDVNVSGLALGLV